LITYNYLASGTGSSANLVVQGFNQSGKVAQLSEGANEIDLVISSVSGGNLVWRGTDASSPYNWDIGTTANFANGGTTVKFSQSDNVTFDDTSANPSVYLMAGLQPGSVTISGNGNNYTFSDGTYAGLGKLTGPGGITKNGSSTLTIGTANNNTGPTVINGGTVVVGDGSEGDLGSGNVINNSALVFAQAGGTSNLVSGQVSGTGTLSQQGLGILILATNNTYSGPTTISSGTLQVGNGGSSGTLGTSVVSDYNALTFKRNDSSIVANPISGSGSVSVNGGVITLTGANSYTGGTAVNANGKLVVGSSSAIPPQSLAVQISGTNDLNGFDLTVLRLTSSQSGGGRIVNNSGTRTNVLTINCDGSSTSDSSITIADNDGSGGKIALVKTGVGVQVLRGSSSYSGGSIISNGIVEVRAGSAFGTGTVLLRGGDVRVYQGQTIANAFQADMNASFLTGTSVGNSTFTGTFSASSNLTFSMSPTATETWTFDGGATQLDGVTGTIYITGGAASFFRFRSSAGSDNATFDLTGSSSQLSSYASGTYHLGALIGDGAGAGLRASSGSTWIVGAKNLNTTFNGNLGPSWGTNNSFTKVGTGRLTLGGTNTFTGQTTVSNGVLALVEPFSCDSNSAVVLGGSTAILDVSGQADGALDLGNSIAQTLSGVGTINGSVNEAANSTVSVGLGSLTVATVATLNGALNMQLNRTNAVNASKLIAGSLVNASALTVTNVGPALQGGDTFQLFKGAVSGFTATNLPALTGSMYWSNNLAVNGSITVVNPVNPNPPVMSATCAGGVLTLSWPANAGWTLQQQTNSLTKGLGTNWVDVPGSAGMTSTNITIDLTKPTVFYRLRL
jgi:autotransporter-associated beta strand protein